MRALFPVEVLSTEARVTAGPHPSDSGKLLSCLSLFRICHCQSQNSVKSSCLNVNMFHYILSYVSDYASVMTLIFR